jgi:hypothetical protein
VTTATAVTGYSIGADNLERPIRRGQELGCAGKASLRRR